MTPTPTLIRLPNGDYVNPAHVVSVRFCEHYMAGLEALEPFTSVETSGNRFTFPGDQRDEVARLINNTPE